MGQSNSYMLALAMGGTLAGGAAGIYLGGNHYIIGELAGLMFGGFTGLVAAVYVEERRSQLNKPHIKEAIYHISNASSIQKPNNQQLLRKCRGFFEEKLELILDKSSYTEVQETFRASRRYLFNKDDVLPEDLSSKVETEYGSVLMRLEPSRFVILSETNFSDYKDVDEPEVSEDFFIKPADDFVARPLSELTSNTREIVAIKNSKRIQVEYPFIQIIGDRLTPIPYGSALDLKSRIEQDVKRIKSSEIKFK